MALDRAGVLHTGSFGSQTAQNQTWMVTVTGVRVAFLAYTEMTNGIPLPHPWSATSLICPPFAAPLTGRGGEARRW